jgi:translocation and assembly module TamA
LVASLRLGLTASAAGLAITAVAGTAAADDPKAVIEGVTDKGLRQAIERYIGETKRPPQSRFEARRRAEEAAEDAVVVLRSEGYYAYQITSDLTEDEKPKPLVRIDPGPRFAIADPQVLWNLPVPDAKAVSNAVTSMGLKPGEPGRAAEVVAAEGRILAALQQNGYADAKAEPREVVVDHADHSVRPTFRIEARDLVRLDGLQVQTDGRTNPRWVGYLAPWKPGEAYAPDKVAELERRLLDTGVYNSVTVSLAPKPDDKGLRPVIVSLSDRPKASVSLGGSYSTREGPGVNGRYSMYNRLGRADTITIAAQYASILKRVDFDVSLPHWRKAQHTLRFGATAYQDDTDAFREKDVGVHADLEHRFGKTSFFTYGLSADYSDADEKTLVVDQIVAVNRKLGILTGLARLSLDRSDDPLDPKKGWRLDGRLEPTFGTGDDTLAYAKVQAQVTAYLPVSRTGSTVLAGRLKLGTIISAVGTPDIPASRRFFAGGGGSIRGYAYQGVGPRFPDGTPIGGQSLIEASAEVRQKLGQRLGLVAFVDAGTVSAQKYPDFRTASVGAGVGARYDLGFGPLRADIGVPLNRRKGDSPFQIYISIGQSF